MKLNYEVTAQVIDFVLKNVAVQKLKTREGQMPTYCLGLDNSDAFMELAKYLAEKGLPS